MKLKSIHFVLSLSLINATSVLAVRVVLALYALELGAEPLTVGILSATFSVFPMLLSVPAGRLADRFGSSWLLILLSITGTFGMLLAYFVTGLPVIFTAVAMSGMSYGISNVLLQNLTGLLSNQQDRTQNFSNFSLIRSVSHVSGSLIAGFSIDLSGHANSCLYLALLTLVPAVMLLIRGGALPGGTCQTKHATGGVRTMLTEPGVRRALATSSFQQSGQDLYQFYMPVYTHAIGLSASVIGVILAMNAAAAFVVRLILPRLIARFKEGKVLACAFYISATSLILVPFFESAAMLALISFAFGLGMGCCQPIVTMLMFSSSAEGRSGEAMGLRMTINHFTKLVGPVAFGSIGSAFGLFPVFWISALMLGTGGMLSQPKHRN